MIRTLALWPCKTTIMTFLHLFQLIPSSLRPSPIFPILFIAFRSCARSFHIAQYSWTRWTSCTMVIGSSQSHYSILDEIWSIPDIADHEFTWSPAHQTAHQTLSHGASWIYLEGWRTFWTYGLRIIWFLHRTTHPHFFIFSYHLFYLLHLFFLLFYETRTGFRLSLSSYLFVLSLFSSRDI